MKLAPWLRIAFNVIMLRRCTVPLRHQGTREQAYATNSYRVQCGETLWDYVVLNVANTLSRRISTSVTAFGGSTNSKAARSPLRASPSQLRRGDTSIHFNVAIIQLHPFGCHLRCRSAGSTLRLTTERRDVCVHTWLYQQLLNTCYSQ